MRDLPKPKFPEGSLLAALLGGQAPPDLRRAAQRLRAEGAPAVAVEDEIAALAGGLAGADVARSPAVLDALPPLFWLEVRRDDGALDGWVVEKKPTGLAARNFGVAADPAAVPEARGGVTVPFGQAARNEDAETRALRGLATAVGLPEMFAQMGEGSPILLLPAEAPARDTAVLRGFRLSVAMPPDAAPD